MRYGDAVRGRSGDNLVSPNLNVQKQNEIVRY